MKLLRPILICTVLAGAGYATWHYAKPAKREAPPPQPVPVSVASSQQGSLPIRISAIGNVRALNTVEIRPQVGGVLVNVAVNEGDEVRKDQVLAVIDPRPYKAALDKAQAQLMQDQAQLENAQLDQRRYSTLAARDFASRQQLDTQTSTVNRLQGVLAADQAAIDEAQINLGFTVLKSPLDGRVGLRRVDPGNLVTANQTGTGILSVVQEQPISVIFSLPETDLPTVREAMRKGSLETLADAPDGSRVLDTGKLATTDNAIDSSSGTIQMRADFPNPNRLLTPGQFVNVRLQVGVSTGVTVPHLAIQHGQAGMFLFSVDPDKTVRRRDVTVAYDDGIDAVLSQGLDAGATVVTVGQTRIGDRTKVSWNDGQNQQRAAQ